MTMIKRRGVVSIFTTSPTVMTTTTRTAKMTTFVLFLLVGGVAIQSVVQAQECSPCYNGAEPTIDEDDDDDECIGLISASQTLFDGTNECRSSQLLNYQKGCCGDDDTSAPHGFCTLCPFGENYDPNIVVPNLDPNADDLTCLDLQNDPDYLDFLFQPGICSDTFLQRSATWCGCTTTTRQCTLCPDGSRPPKPQLVDPVYYNWNCDTFDFVSSFFNSEECIGLASQILEFDAAAYCGCPGVEPPNIKCALCPEGQEIIFPNLKLGSSKSFTCRELALSTWYIPTHSTCVRVLEGYLEQDYIAECCGVPSYNNNNNDSSSGNDSNYNHYYLSSSSFLGLVTMAIIEKMVH